MRADAAHLSSMSNGTIFPRMTEVFGQSDRKGGVVGPGSARGQGAGQWAALQILDLLAQGERAR